MDKCNDLGNSIWKREFAMRCMEIYIYYWINGFIIVFKIEGATLGVVIKRSTLRKKNVYPEKITWLIKKKKKNLMRFKKFPTFAF